MQEQKEKCVSQRKECEFSRVMEINKKKKSWLRTSQFHGLNIIFIIIIPSDSLKINFELNIKI